MARGSIARITTPKRKQIAWEARLSGRDRDGDRRQFRRRFPTKITAQEWLSEMEATIHIDGVSVSADMTLAEYAAVWHGRMERGWAPSTTYARRSIWERQLQDTVGQRKLDQIRRVDCQQLVDSMLASGLSVNYVRAAVTHLSAMLRAAVGDELISRNPAMGLTLPPATRADMTTWTVEQARTFLAGTRGSAIHPICYLMLGTGMRIGEVLALSWDRVNLDAGTVQVVATIQLGVDGSVHVAQTTKTRSSRRTVPIHADLVDVLRAHRDRHRETFAQRHLANPAQLVFPGPTGDRLDPNRVRRMITAAIDRVGLPRISPRQFRHTAATLMMERGIPAKVAQELLGHASITMTLDIYSHVGEGMRRSATDTLGELLQDATTPLPEIEEKTRGLGQDWVTIDE